MNGETKKKYNEKKDKKSVVEHIVSHKGLIKIILGICASLYPIVNTVYKIMYQGECEKFYGIPGKYFDSKIDNRLLYLCCIIILLMISIMPAFMKKYYEKRKFNKRVFGGSSLFVGRYWYVNRIVQCL